MGNTTRVAAGIAMSLDLLSRTVNPTSPPTPADNFSQNQQNVQQQRQVDMNTGTAARNAENNIPAEHRPKP
jgi:hypothetical protein